MKNTSNKSIWIILPVVLFFSLSCASTKKEKTESKDADAYFNRGVAYQEKGQYDEAISNYTKALEIRPKLTVAYYNRARSCYFKKEYDKAWEDIKKAQDLGYQIPSDFLEDLRKASGRR